MAVWLSGLLMEFPTSLLEEAACVHQSQVVSVKIQVLAQLAGLSG